MNQSDVEELMRSSKTEKEWNCNCDIVKKEYGDYPDFWYSAIIMSGLASTTSSQF